MPQRDLSWLTWPDRKTQGRTVFAFLGSAILLGAAAWLSGVGSWTPQPPTLALFGTLSLLFVIPSLLEELLFRGVLHPRADASYRLLRIFAVAALFVLWHPLQYWSGIGPPWSAQFVTLPFLVTVTVLALCLGALREISGSIWPSVLLHWLVVCCWKALFGGPF